MNQYIRVKKSKIHGTGIHVKKQITKGRNIIEYVGEKITKKESDRRYEMALEHGSKNGNGTVYLFELNKRYDIDGDVNWNSARFINHSCEPNCEVEISKGKIWIVALRNIEKGEELSYNYGYDIADYQDHVCRCGTKKCVGYILDEDEWHKLKKAKSRA